MAVIALSKKTLITVTLFYKELHVYYEFFHLVLYRVQISFSDIITGKGED